MSIAFAKNTLIFTNIARGIVSQVKIWYNENGKYDGWIYNLPFVKRITVIGIFHDPRDLSDYNCCNAQEYLDLGAISNEVKMRLTKQKLQYYRQNLQSPQPNNLIPR